MPVASLLCLFSFLSGFSADAPKKIVLKGVIKKVITEDGRVCILLEQKGNDLVWCNTRKETPVVGPGKKKAKLSDLKVGLRVRVETIDRFADSDPPQAGAERITIEDK